MAKLKVISTYTAKAPWFFTLNVNVESQKLSVLRQVNEKLNVPSGTFLIICHGPNSEASIDPTTAREHKLHNTPEKIVNAFNSVDLIE